MTIKNNVLALIALTVLSLVGFSNEAKAEGTATACYIHLDAPCDGNLAFGPQSGWFKDFEPISNANAARCLQRAAEYYSYCGDKVGRQTVYAYFTVGTHWIIFAAKNKSTSYTASPGSAKTFGVIPLGQ